MRRALTKAEGRAFRARWRLVNSAERDELRTTPLERKLAQAAALMTSAHLFGADSVPSPTPGSHAVGPVVRETPPRAPLADVLKDLVDWLAAAGVRGIVIGGVAASLLARPRFTRDVDVLVLLEDDRWEDFVASGAPLGFFPRRDGVLEFARRARVLLMRHAPSQIDVDVVIGTLPFEQEVVDRASVVVVDQVSMPLPSPEDLIVMKAVARRPTDLADIESIMDAHPKLDLRRVRRWVREFAATLEAPDILAGLESVLGNRRKRRKSSGADRV